MLHQLSRDQQRLYQQQLPPLRAVAVDDNADCSGCFFDNRGACPVTQSGCAACTGDVRDDGKTIVWQVAP